ncbi:MAG TPA: FAD-dependent oxidoreductase [Thermoanaerobaculia bacterium]|nr:FAD-dependent oxidoreductase [Thermoanaerobaculia bacterium]
MEKGQHVAVVGGGLAGLAASIYLARGGKSVTVFERSQSWGGRAATQIHDGFRFNLGPHAMYRGGEAMQVLRELGITVNGKRPPGEGLAIRDDGSHKLPASFLSLATTTLLDGSAKVEAAMLLQKLRWRKSSVSDTLSVREWLDQQIHNPDVRLLVEALIRLSTYCDEPDLQSAGAAVRQLQSAVRRGVLYVDEGWQTLVDGLRAAAVSSGVNFVSNSKVVAVNEEGGTVRGIELGGLQSDEDLENSVGQSRLTREQPIGSIGASIKTDVVLLAIAPAAAAKLVPDSGTLRDAATTLTPIHASSLDVALSELPRAETIFALGLHQPLYLSVHSATARLAPGKGAMLHVMKYLRSGDKSAPEEELEGFLEEMQPGWRERVVSKRFLPKLVVSNGVVTAAGSGFAGRPPVAVADIENLYVAGDWVGSEGMLANASLASARKAARTILSS